jgi:hypothetical protein
VKEIMSSIATSSGQVQKYVTSIKRPIWKDIVFAFFTRFTVFGAFAPVHFSNSTFRYSKTKNHKQFLTLCMNRSNKHPNSVALL